MDWFVVGCICRWCCVNCLCFFFFKQKTAYEMRISDWSSDVCSSDLLEVLDAVDRVTNVTIERRMEGRRAGDPDALVSDNARILEALPWRQIGRASCRERVCQYV